MNSTQPQQTAQPSQSPSSTSHLSHGQIAGISVGIALAVLLLLGCWCLLVRHRRKHNRTYSAELTQMRELSGSIVQAVSVAQARNSTYQYELFGDLGGTQMRGDVEAVELSARDVSARA